MPKQLQLTLLSSTPLGDTPPPTSASPTLLHSLPSGSGTPPAGYRRPANLRRQSSISYITTPTSSPKTPSRHATTRSMSYNSPLSPRSFAVSPAETKSPTKGPLTLAEEHADLLSEMATKESLCLELKSQLVTHEAELQSLKEKWHKIISGGTPNMDSPPPETLITGFKDGMNNMGKFIAAGISEVVAPVPPAPRYQATPMVRRTHSSKASTASSSTSSNSSVITRLSESSVSSVDETTPNAEDPDAVEEKRDVPQPLPKVTSRLNSPPSSPLKPAVPRHSKQKSLTTDFPVPGIGIASLISTPAVSGWLSNIGSRWEDLQKTQTYTKGHERATSLMNDITQTFTQAFPPQPSLSVSSSESSATGASTLTPIPESHSTSETTSKGVSNSSMMTAESDVVADEWNW